MKRHIYIFLGLLIIAVAVSLNGCAGFVNGIELTLAEKSFSEKADQHNRDVLNCLRKHDANSLKKMFSKKTRSTEDLDAQIKAAFDFFDGNIEVTDKTKFNSYGMQSSTEHGKFVLYVISPTVTGIQTDKGRTYDIVTCENLVNKYHPNYVGIMEIDILADDGSKCAIGKFLK